MILDEKIRKGFETMMEFIKKNFQRKICKELEFKKNKI